MKINYFRIVKIVVIVVYFVLIYHHTLIWLANHYSLIDGYYSHGPLVPLVSLFLVWLKKDRLKNVNLSGYLWGLVLLITGLMLQILSNVVEIFLISELSIIFVVVGIILYLFGRTVVKELWFPFFFLIFMFPIPAFLINHITFPLRIIATKSAVTIMDVLNLPVIQHGFEIIFPNDSLLVDTPCSGLRSLITFLAIGSLVAYFLNGSTAKKIFIFILSIPIAFLSNLLRLLMLSVVTYIYGAKFATQGFFHTFSGIVVFILGFGVLLVLRRMLECQNS